MSSKKVAKAIFALVLILVFGTNTVSANYSTFQKRNPYYPPIAITPSIPSAEINPSLNLISQGELGKPGTSFRYVKTIGETDTPYVDSTTLLNRPLGLFIAPGTDEMFITEEQGSRVLKYNTNKTHLLTLGRAGISRSDEGYLQFPNEAVPSPDGHIWVADWTRILEYTSSGTLIQSFPSEESWAGGTDHGRFDGASSMAFDLSGHLFVADQYNHRVEIFTWAVGMTPQYKATIGTGSPGNGSNQLNHPMRVRVHPNGDLFVLDHGNDRALRCPYSAGSDSWSCTVFKSGLNDPQGLYVDQNGTVYIGDTGNGLIYKCATASCTSFHVNGGSYGVAVDSDGNIYSTEAWYTVVQKYDANGNFIENFLGQFQKPYPIDDEHFNAPRVEIDQQGNMLVLEERGHRLLKFAPGGSLLWSFGVAGVDEWGSNQYLNSPHGLDTDKDGNIYVASSWRVMKISKDGEYLGSFGTEKGDDPNRTIGWVTDVAVNDATGYVYLADSVNHVVLVYNRTYTQIGKIGTSGQCLNTTVGFCGPVGIEVDSSGNVYVGDWGNSRVQKFNNLHQWVMTLGITGEGGEEHNQISGPDDIEVDGKGNIYVADMSNNRVQVFDTTGSYLATIGGTWGPGTAEFRALSDVSVDSAGRVYVSDIQSMRIQIYEPGYNAWAQKNVNGFGERWQPNISGLEVYNGQLYASTCYWGTGSQVWKTANGSDWVLVADSGVINGPDDGCITNLEVFNNELYATNGWGSNPASLWRFNGTRWEKVLDVEAMGFYGLEAYDGKIYACSHQATFDGPGLSIFASATGNLNDWQEMASGGNGNPNNYVCSLGQFQGRLYAFTENEVDGLEVWRLNTAGTGWDVLATNGLGDSTNFSSGGITEFNNTLYLGSWSREHGGIIQKSTNGTDWSTVMTGGFGNPTNQKVESLVLFNGWMYAVLNNPAEGIEVWRSTNGTTWEPFSTMGFGDPENTNTLGNNATIVYGGSLFLGVQNDAKGGQVLALLHRKLFIPHAVR